MGISSSTLQPQELVTFKKLPQNVPLGDIQIPERPENRRPTNVKWLITLGIFVALLLPFLIYTLYYSDPDRVIYGYDKCGNICGRLNYKWDNIECSGKDLTTTPFLEYESGYVGGTRAQDILFEERTEFTDKRCVQSCRNGFVGVAGRCFRKASDNDITEITSDGISVQKADHRDLDIGVYFSSVKWQLAISCLISILVAMGMLFLFRYAVAFVVWGILIGCLVGLFILVAGLWYGYITIPVDTTKQSQDTKSVLLVFSIVFTVVAVVVSLVLVWCRQKIRLLIMLLKETTKAVFDMPGLIVVPVVCVVVLGIVSLLFFGTMLVMSSAGTLQRLATDFYTYEPNAVMIFTVAYNFAVFLWLTQFFTGIQYMVIAGAVSKWYFTRDKFTLTSPIFQSISITFKFHLGSIALGSLIITLIQIVKSIILGLVKNEKFRAFVESCVDAVESFFKFLSRNAYIITAMHGQAFLKSGKRAARLLIQNIGDVIAINYIGDFVLGMAKFLIVVVTVLLSMGIFAIAPGAYESSNIYSYIIVAFVASVVAFVSFGVFETAIDTIFICYCEDNILNDGMSKEYYASRNLKEFIEESKQVYGKK